MALTAKKHVCKSICLNESGVCHSVRARLPITAAEKIDTESRRCLAVNASFARASVCDLVGEAGKQKLHGRLPAELARAFDLHHVLAQANELDGEVPGCPGDLPESVGKGTDII